MYLNKDFPIHLKESDLNEIRAAIANESEFNNTQKHFLRGMQHFYVAIWDTYQMAHDVPRDIDAINRHWRKSLQHLQSAGHLSPLLAQNILAFLNDADSNRDGKWDQQELTHMIRRRLKVKS